jgi:hypothetical protein
MTLNWKPVTESLFRHLQDAGFRVIAVHDGADDGYQAAATTAQAVDLATGVDTAHVRVQRGDAKATLTLIYYDNEPEELVVDWSCPDSASTSLLLDQAISRFSQEWECKPCPTTSDP